MGAKNTIEEATDGKAQEEELRDPQDSKLEVPAVNEEIFKADKYENYLPRNRKGEARRNADLRLREGEWKSTEENKLTKLYVEDGRIEMIVILFPIMN